MHVKIYFDAKPLFLCDEIDAIIEPYVHHEDSIFVDELNTHTVKTMLHEMQQEKVHAGIFYHPDLEELKRAVWKKFSVIVAAGGLIKNEKGEILVIFRRGKWDLPKGKLDEGEQLDSCALREVEEETGLSNVRLTAPLTVTYHTYHEGTKLILKESHWFAMKADSSQLLTPQVDEDITEIKWADKKELETYLQNSFPLIADVITAAATNN